MLKKAESVLQKYGELSDKLADPAVLADMDAWKKISKEHADITELASAAEEYKRVFTEMNDAFEMAEAESDKEMKDMLLDEGYACKEKLSELAENLKILLLPKDKNDERDCVLEIRAGVGGEESALFAAELLRMYQGFCSKNRLKLEIEDENATELGGIKEVTAHVSGNGAYKLLKYESGVHRVQRVPETETQGRIHTSAVSVAVMPEAEEVDVELNDKDIRIDIYHSGGAGGQNVNKVASAVRLTHLPTGIVVQCQNERSQLQNKALAYQILRTRLYDYYNSQSQSEYDQNRKNLIGSGDRSERIRTYNFPQSRVTDHRIGLSLFSIESFMLGDIGEMVDALAVADREAQLAASAQEE
ncbi:MAG: peptide chain release factor 1 [Clostridia bacterium]|nr:peptide chain release factor 1 [Clostridia bacterium]